MAKKEDQRRYNFLAHKDLARRLDMWRRKQDDLPNVSEAIRRILEERLDADLEKSK